jgi:hypothetical protein
MAWRARATSAPVSATVTTVATIAALAMVISRGLSCQYILASVATVVCTHVIARCARSAAVCLC